METENRESWKETEVKGGKRKRETAGEQHKEKERNDGRNREKDRKEGFMEGKRQTASYLRNGLINTIDRTERGGERGRRGRDGAAVERRGLIEIILTSFSNLFRGKHASDS